MSGVEKRKGDTPEDASQEAKRARVAAPGAPAAAPGAGAAKPGALSVLERARQALAKKKELEERLQRLKAAKEAAAGVGRGAASAAQGSVSAAAAAVGSASAPPVAAAAAGSASSGAAIAAAAAAAKAKAAAAAAALAAAVKAKAAREAAAAGGGAAATVAAAPPAVGATSAPSASAASASAPVSVPAADLASAFFDPNLSSGPQDRRRSRTGALRFLDPGELSRRAEAMRRSGAKASGSAGPPAGPAGGKASTNPNLAPLGQRVAALTGGLSAREQRAPPPAVEWWDAKVLQDKTGYHPVAGGQDGRRDGEDGAANGAAEDVKAEGGGEGEAGAGGAKGKEEGGSAVDLGAGDDAMADASSSSSSSSSSRVFYALHPGRVTLLIEHPVLISPPGEAPPPPPAPLRLTPKEMRKLRTQRRRAREEEKQELIRRGVLEPPPPKVRLSNLPRVLGELAAADPTAIEQEVRRQMAERAEAHADRNAARKLTPLERKDKNLRKVLGAREVVVVRREAAGDEALEGGGARGAGGAALGVAGAGGGAAALGVAGAGAGALAAAAADPLAALTGGGLDGGLSASGSASASGAPSSFSAALRAAPATALTGTRVQVFRTSPLLSRAARYKVRTNAAELHLAGVALSPAGAPFTVVVAEGLPKPLKKFKRLLEHRIDWIAAGVPSVSAADDADDAAAERDPPGCRLVWEGEVAKPAFGAFRVDAPQDVFSARAALVRAGVGHYWDAAEACLAAEEQ